MTHQETATLKRILSEIKEAATGFGDMQPELINRLCDVNYLASRAMDLLPAARQHRSQGVGARR